MDIQDSTAARPQARNTTSPAERGAATTALSSDFETFLKMLTTQMENQDPLNPLQSSDFAVQLATFSGVEQQVRTNDLLSGLAAQLSTSGMAQLASWIGTEVRSDGPVLFEGEPITLFPTPAQGADAAFLIVKDETGRIVAQNEIPVSQEPLVWAGVAANGTPFAEGVYSFEVESRAQGEFMANSAVEHYSRVQEVKNEPGGAVLVMSGGVSLKADEILAVRGAQSG